MLKELKERRGMGLLPISAFSKVCNDVLGRFKQSKERGSTVTPRTIRYYTQEGLLPAPTLKQGQACYGYEHLLRVIAIKFYQTQFLPLRLIRQRLAERGKTALEQLITDAVMNQNGVLPADAVAGSATYQEDAMMTAGQTVNMILPEIPPQTPINPHEAVRIAPPIVPIVYDSPAGMEYRVLTRSSLDATRLEADLNALGREGWWLVQILPQEKNVFLVFMRWAEGATP